MFGFGFSRQLMVSVALACAVGCSGAPVASQTFAQASDPTVEPPQPMAIATDAPAPTAAPTSEPTAAAPTSVPTPTAQPVPTSAPAAAPVLDADASAAQLASCDPSAPPPAPLPRPGTPRTGDFFRSFRDPLPPAPLYDPPGPKRVALQAGHWLVDQVPAELRGLQAGAVGGGRQEWQVNLDVAQRTQALLEDAGLQVDLLPATVPPHYQANVFVALHADGDTSGAGRGFKVARPGFSSIPSADDRLVDAINQTYGAETELPRDDEHITLRMLYYYAFNSRRYCHAVMPGVPQAIVEMGYLTSATDRQYLIGDPQRLAQALADSIQTFLATTP